MSSETKRGSIAVLLAVMLGVTLLGWFVASGNFALVDPEENPELFDHFTDIADERARAMSVRYVASESNRAMFGLAGPLQLALVLASFALYWFGCREIRGNKRLTGLFGLVVVAGLVTAVLVPSIIDKGRAIDFVSREPEPPPAVTSFQRIHVAYVLTDMVKVVATVALLYFLLRARAAAEGAGGAASLAFGAQPQGGAVAPTPAPTPASTLRRPLRRPLWRPLPHGDLR